MSLCERLTRLFGNNAIQVASKPVETLQQEFLSPKFRQSLDLQCSLLVYVVYNVPCKGCPWNYVRETGDAFKSRTKEHQRHKLKALSLSTIRGKIIIPLTSLILVWSTRATAAFAKRLHCWHTAKSVCADKNSIPLPRLYLIVTWLDVKASKLRCFRRTSLAKFFKRHGAIIETYGITLREMSAYSVDVYA